jgi:DNA-binding transcriptional regulator YiaG
MSNLAVVIKDEIRRLAKREIKAATGSTKQAVAQYRRDIAKLKRLLQSQQKEIAFLKAQEQKRLGQPETKEDGELEGVRFSARSVRAQRKRLKLSILDYARLLGVSPLTIYHWEGGQGRPRKERLAALVAVRDMGRREVAAKLAMLKAESHGAKKAVRKPR